MKGSRTHGSRQAGLNCICTVTKGQRLMSSKLDTPPRFPLNYQSRAVIIYNRERRFSGVIDVLRTIEISSRGFRNYCVSSNDSTGQPWYETITKIPIVHWRNYSHESVVSRFVRVLSFDSCARECKETRILPTNRHTARRCPWSWAV